MLGPAATAVSRRTKNTLDNGKRHVHSRAGPICFGSYFAPGGAFRHVRGASVTRPRANLPKTRPRRPLRAVWRRLDPADNFRAG
jgi:hypothetical protein